MILKISLSKKLERPNLMKDRLSASKIKFKDFKDSLTNFGSSLICWNSNYETSKDKLAI